MGVIVILVIASLTVSGIFLLAFLWATKSGQYDDTTTPSIRMLFDDKPPNNDNRHTEV